MECLPCFNPIFFMIQYVKFTDRSLIPIKGKGTINAGYSFTLRSVLYVPNFSANLLSINNITKLITVRLFSILVCFSGLATERSLVIIVMREGCMFLIHRHESWFLHSQHEALLNQLYSRVVPISERT